jgi:hypothetical protein
VNPQQLRNGKAVRRFAAENCPSLEPTPRYDGSTHAISFAIFAKQPMLSRLRDYCEWLMMDSGVVVDSTSNRLVDPPTGEPEIPEKQGRLARSTRANWPFLIHHPGIHHEPFV